MGSSDGRADRAGHWLAGPPHGLRLHRGQSRTRRVAGTQPVAHQDRLAARQRRRRRSDRDLCFGTVDTWLAWTLTGGTCDVTDHTNAAVTGLCGEPGEEQGARSDLRDPYCDAPADRRLERCHRRGDGAAREPRRSPPSSATNKRRWSGRAVCAEARRRSRSDRRHVRPVHRGSAPGVAPAGDHGTYPIVAWSRRRSPDVGHRGDHAVGRHERAVAGRGPRHSRSPAESHHVAASVPGTDGVVYVSALLGLGTPNWDFGARGTLLGITRGTTTAHVVRAVLDGVAQRAVDLVEAAESDTGLTIGALRVDGGMSANPTFVQALADFPGAPWRSHRSLTGRRSEQPFSPAWPSGCGVTSTRRLGCGTRGSRPTRTIGPPIGRTGRVPLPVPQGGFRSCQHSTSRLPGVRRQHRPKT